MATWIANDLPARFAERIPPIDHTVAEHWGDRTAQSRRGGVALSVMNGFFTAIALAEDAALVTRNVKDFCIIGDPGMTRTRDLRFRKPSLDPAELRGPANWERGL